MHIYIYDHFLNQRKYEKIVSKIETRITDLGLGGKNCRVGPLKGLKSIVKEEMRNNPNTIVAIGNNETLNSVVNAFEEERATIGIIPVGPLNSIANTLGIKDEDSACNILSARLIEQLDLGLINDTFFISSAKINTQGTIMEVNESYTIEPVGTGIIEIINLNTTRPELKVNPTDGYLETYIDITKKSLLSKSSNQSYLRSNRLIINNLNNNNFLIDEVVEVSAPAQIGLIHKKLSIIVGKDRQF